MLKRFLALLAPLALAWMLALPAPASAQSSYPTPGGSGVDGKVMMCLNGSNQAVPCSSATPLQVTGGNVSNATQLSIGATNLPVVSFLYLFNGTNFDQWSDSVVPGAANVAIAGCASGVCAPTSPANGVTNSVNVTSSGTSVQIAAARTGAIGTGRVSITVFNPVGAPGTLYIGFGASGTCPSVATLTGNGAGAGVPIAAGAAFTQSVSAQVCGAYAASSGYVPYQESY